MKKPKPGRFTNPEKAPCIHCYTPITGKVVGRAECERHVGYVSLADRRG